MTAFDGVLFDGRTTARHPVAIQVTGAWLSVVRDGVPASIACDDIRVDPPIPGVPRRLVLPGGAVIETANTSAVEAVWPTRRAIERAAYWLESRVAAAVASVAIVAVAIWLVVEHVLPLAAEPVARSISPRIENAIGKQALESIDAIYAKPSGLSDERRRTLRQSFEALTRGDAEDVELAFRRMGGPNAFALPGRAVVLTDEMVQFARNDDELMAVLAHELGHVHHRHAMRMVLQQSGVAVLVTALAGDAVGMTILAVMIPAALLNARYSRAFELEADDYAIALLRRHGRSPQALVDVLKRFSEDRRTANANDPVSRYLSSHPELDLRIRRVEQAR